MTNLAASVGRWKNDEYNLAGKIIQTCNPAKNYLYREYYKKNKDGVLESWKRFVQALPTDNKKLASGYLEHLRRTLSKNEKIRLLDGNWEYDDDPATMIEYDSICNIFTNSFVKGTGKRYITADVARFGKDATVIRVWDGWRVIFRVELRKKRTTEVAEEIKRLAELYSVTRSNIIIDEDGIGGGVVDLLPKCVGFTANSTPKYLKPGEAYKNLKSQCAFKMAEKVNSNEVFEDADPIVKDRLTEDLEQVKQLDADKQVPKGIVPKETVMKIIGRSPDDGDTYIMRAYFDLLPTGTSSSGSW
jgi:hypothetical protein